MNTGVRKYLLDFYELTCRAVTEAVCLEPRQVLIESTEAPDYLAAVVRETAWPDDPSDGYLRRFREALVPDAAVRVLATRARRSPRRLAERRAAGRAG